MTTRVRYRYVSWALLALAGSCSGCSDVIWRPDLTGAQRDAAKDGRVVLVYYASTLNRDCAKMNRTVFNDDDVIQAMAGTIPVRVGPVLHGTWAEQQGITTIPSFATFGSDGKRIHLRQGVMDSAQFRAFVISSKLSQ